MEVVQYRGAPKMRDQHSCSRSTHNTWGKGTSVCVQAWSDISSLRPTLAAVLFAV